MQLSLAAVFALIMVVSTGCERRESPPWVVAVAWWIEDRVRGVPRDPDELRRDDAPAGCAAVAEWVTNPRPGGQQVLVEPLSTRAERWPELLALLATGMVHTTPTGLATTATGATRVRILALLAREQGDRERGDGIISGLLELGTVADHDFRSRVAEIRRQADDASSMSGDSGMSATAALGR